MRRHLLMPALLIVAGSAGCTVDPPPQPASRPGVASSATPSGTTTAVAGSSFTAYYGRDIAAHLAEVAKPQPQVAFHAITGPTTALDGSVHDVDLAALSAWSFTANVPIFDGNADVYYKLTLPAGMPGVTGKIQLQGTANAPILASYDIRYHTTHPYLGGPWDFRAVAPKTSSAATAGVGP